MTPEQQAAYVMSQAACALCEAFGMAAENYARRKRGEPPAYIGNDFEALIDRYGISHNAVVGMFMGNR